MDKSTARKYAAYALAGTAMGVPAANASVISVTLGPDDYTGSDPANTQLFNIDGTDATNDYQLSVFAGPSFGSTAGAVSWLSLGANQVVVTGGNVDALSPGTLIDSSSNWGNDSLLLYKKTVATDGNWANDATTPSYIGLQFDIGGSTHYGWVSVGAEADGTPYALARVYAYGYEIQPDIGVLAGDTVGAPDPQGGEVPEPSTFALFALGLSGVMAWKRRRNQQAG